MTVALGDATATPADIRAIAAGESIDVAEAGLERVRASRAVVDGVLASGSSVYGLTTRLGAGRDERIDPDELLAFQRQVVRNHDAGAGARRSTAEVRALLAARIAVLLNGGAGVRVELVLAAAALIEDPPALYELGSVGAADLVPLAGILRHLVDDGFELAPHEAAAFLSANAATIGSSALAVGELDALVRAADAAVGLSLQALGSVTDAGDLTPYSAPVVAAGGRPAAAASAARIRLMVAEGFLDDSDRAASVQDPLSFRTAPQVHGAVADVIARLDDEVAVELAARPENPVVVDGRMLSGGNFTALPLALAIENARLAIAHLAAASERRTAILSAELRPFRSAGRTRLPGLSWYAAADALAELRQLAAPASLGATVLSGVEDVASFAPTALRLLQRGVVLARVVLGVEALHAAELLALADARPRVGRASADAFAALDGLLGDPLAGTVEQAFDVLVSVRSG